MSTRKGKSVTGMLFAGNIGKVVIIFLLLLAVTTVVASAQCDYNVTVLGVCCDATQTEGWFYNDTTGWDYFTAAEVRTPLFNLSVDGDEYYAYCINFEVFIRKGDNFNASIYAAEPTCKNNSIAYILNNWTHSCSACDNVSAAQSAIWYFWYLNDTFCSLGSPKYNHTALPNQTGWESQWIPNCTAHPDACTFVNTSINKSVPYNIGITPGSGSFPEGTPIELEATVSYCGEVGENVTVVFETDTGNISGFGNVYETETSNGIARATLICEPGVDSATVTARVKDMKWFEIVDPTECQATEYQETFRFANIISNDANFSFYTRKVPALSLPFIIFLAIMLSVIAISAIRRSKL